MKTKQRKRGWETPTCCMCQQAKAYWTPTGYITPSESVGHPAHGREQEGVWMCDRCDLVLGLSYPVQSRSVG